MVSLRNLPSFGSLALARLSWSFVGCVGGRTGRCPDLATGGRGQKLRVEGSNFPHFACRAHAYTEENKLARTLR